MRVVEAGGFFELSPAPELVTGVRVDTSLVLMLVGPGSVGLLIRIEAPFRLRDGRLIHEVHPGDTSTVAPVLSLIRRRVSRLRAARDGRLLANFEGGMAIEVEADGPFESWHITVTGGPMLIGGPDRTISVFDGAVSERPTTH